MPMSNRIPIRRLRKILGKDRVLTRLEQRVLYSYDATPFQQIPEVVIMPREEDEVLEAIRFAREYGLSITPRGAGTGMSGGAIPASRAMTISSEKMNRILRIDEIQRFALVEPGVLTGDLQEQVLEWKLFYPPDPSSYLVSTMGGNVAEGAGGLRCAKYGVTKDYVIGLRVATAEGQIVGTGALDAGNPHPDLTPLFVGSEGTLGYITQILVRLIDAPDSARAMVAFFPTASEAAAAVTSVLTAKLMPSVMEFLDRMTLKAIIEYAPLNIPEQAEAMILVEVDGKAETLAGELASIIEVCQAHGGFGIEEASDPKEREELWSLRRSVSPSLARLASGKINEDVCVPRGELIRLVEWCQALSEETGLVIPVYGHAADGNLHVNVMYDKDNRPQGKLAYEIVERIFKYTLELGGTLSGEHGIGRAKQPYLHLQFPPEALEYFRRIKQVWDPKGLFNPGVLYAEENSVESP
jgi:glycolate oxidase